MPLFLSVCLGLSALATGVRLLPLSITLLAAAIGIPRFFPSVSPRLVVRCGLLALLAGTVVLLGALDADAGPGDRLRADAADRPRDRRARLAARRRHRLGGARRAGPEVGGVQNTMTNLGASIGTALAGSILIAALSSAFLTNIEQSPAIPSRVKSEANVQLAGGVPFVSDADLQHALDEAHVSSRATDAALDAYQDARINGLRSALAILALMAIIALFFAGRIPTKQPGST